jgi:LacI family sucrose operon transcriptional repressor
MEVCRKHGIPFLEVETQAVQFRDMSYEKVIEQVLREHPDIDGVFANSDVIAAQVLQVCRTLRIEVPSRMKIVGFDDTYIARITNPTLTTIHQPIEEMAELAMKHLCDAISGKLVPKSSILPVYLVGRETV